MNKQKRKILYDVFYTTLCSILCMILIIGGICTGGSRTESLNVWLEERSAIPSSKIPSTSKIWKHSKGESIGPYLNFKAPKFMYIQNDTLFHVEKPVGIIIQTKKHFLLNDI